MMAQTSPQAVVTRAASTDVVRSIGADEIINHEAEDFTRRRDRWDVIFDIGGTRPFGRCQRVMEPDGILLAIGAPAGRWIAPAGPLLEAVMLSPLTRRRRIVPFVAKSDPPDLALLAGLVERGTITPVIDRCFALSETAEAVRHLGAGRARVSSSSTCGDTVRGRGACAGVLDTLDVP
ncbi:MAG TPA: zinc-binding dehydrogenase [Vicinamibacterales bacterium]|nr:zinc-binding dehydrogenase [Vicinamibacterales bacterium]